MICLDCVVWGESVCQSIGKRFKTSQARFSADWRVLTQGKSKTFYLWAVNAFWCNIKAPNCDTSTRPSSFPCETVYPRSLGSVCRAIALEGSAFDWAKNTKQARAGLGSVLWDGTRDHVSLIQTFGQIADQLFSPLRIRRVFKNHIKWLCIICSVWYNIHTQTHIKYFTHILAVHSLFIPDLKTGLFFYFG